MCLQWAPNGKHFASSGSDNVVRLWSTDHRCLSGVEADLPRTAIASSRPSLGGANSNGTIRNTEGQGQDYQPAATMDRCLVFRHAGHRCPVVDLHWNPLQTWVLATLSDDGAVSLWFVCNLELACLHQVFVLSQLSCFIRVEFVDVMRYYRYGA